MCIFTHKDKNKREIQKPLYIIESQCITKTLMFSTEQTMFSVEQIFYSTEYTLYI